MEIKKSKNDSRDYHSLELPNGLQVLIVHDSQTKISAAALKLRIGMLDDPREYQGLAHFCEHMLFMGSRKYPEQNDYAKFVQANAGETNASTSLQSTKYYFSVSSNFEGALDRFAQFFIEPLFSESCIEREMNAVDSEFNLSLADDDERMWEIARQQARPDSTFNTFGCGNLETLNKQGTRDALLKFYASYYCASLMKLTIYTHLPIEEISKLVVDLFSHVPNRNIKQPQHIDNPYEQKTQLFKVVGVKQEHVLYISFVMPNYRQHYQSKPQEYVSHLIGHEGRNSLTSFLKDEGLITELSCGSQEFNDATSEFYIEIVLTEDGFEDYEKVIAYLFRYVGLINIEPWIFEELAKIEDINFDHLEKSGAVEYTQVLVSRIHMYPLKDILYGHYNYEVFSPELIAQVLTYICPKNMKVFLRSDSFASDSAKWKVEPWCKTKYTETKCDKLLKFIQNAKLTPEYTTKNLDMPLPNPFVSTDFNVFNSDQEVPLKIIDEDVLTVYALKDSKFKISKTCIGLNLFPNQDFVLNPKQRLLADLWMSLFDQYFQEISYEAECASVTYSLSLEYNKIAILMDGFSDSILLFFKQFIQEMNSFKQSQIKDYIFENLFDELKDRIDNYFQKSPYDLVLSYFKNVIYKQGKFFKEQLKDIEITLEEMQAFIPEFMKFKVELFIHGNVTDFEINQIISEVRQLQLAPIVPIPMQILKVEHPLAFQKVIDNKEDPNSAIIVHFQGEGSTDPVREYHYDLLNQIMSDAVENQLRTNEQLGYVAYSRAICRRGVHGINIMIVSQNKAPNQMALRIDAFIEEYVKQISSFNEEEFHSARESFIQEKEQDYQSLYDQFKTFNGQIKLHTLDFFTKSLVRKRAETMTFEKFKLFAIELLTSKCRLEIHILNPKHTDIQRDILTVTKKPQGQYYEDLFLY